MPRSSRPAAMARSDSHPASCSSLIVGARSIALLRARSCPAALPAARALAVKRAPRSPPSFTPRRLAAARAAFVRAEIIPASSSATVRGRTIEAEATVSGFMFLPLQPAPPRTSVTQGNPETRNGFWPSGGRLQKCLAYPLIDTRFRPGGFSGVGCAVARRPNSCPAAFQMELFPEGGPANSCVIAFGDGTFIIRGGVQGGVHRRSCRHCERESPELRAHGDSP
jgi:hypothetical protein